MKTIVTFILASAALFANAQFQAIGLAKNKECINNMKQLGLAYNMFLDDHGKQPETFQELSSYISMKITDCPNAKSKKQYILIPSLGTSNAKAPVVMDRIGNHPNEINVLYRDGHAATLRYSGNNYKNMVSLFKGLTQNEQKKLTDFFKQLDEKK